MTTITNDAKQLKKEEIKAQQAKLQALQADLAKLENKVKNNEKLSTEDTSFISSLGWLSALSVTITSVAASM